MDLVPIGPEFANRYYRICHLHFRVEMFRNIEGRIYLSKEAVPSIFLKPLQQTGDGNSSTTLFQPISFVTIFLKPESRNRNSTDLSQSEVSETHPMKPDERDTAIISPVQALFPRSSLKQTYEDRNVSSAQTLLLDVKKENDNRDIIDLTSIDSPVPTTSKTVSVCTPPSKTVSICTPPSKTVSICTTSSKTIHTTQQNVLNISATNYRNIDLRLPERSAFKRVCEFLLNECLLVHVNCNICIAYATKESNSSSRDTSSSFHLYVSSLEDTFMRNFEKLSIEKNLGAQMLQLAQQIDYKPPCPDFPIVFLIKLFLRMRVYFTLSRHNKICKGIESRSSLNVIQL
ncbi:hypothetical protein ALC53_10798 [Atta colombica]|uniref:THAP-type domain-containing protein n=1 Tax=Atta colombica TaxID=520822 RepID=A0A195B3H2_9HYME|nr:hypothetical protein ALC53_10798 [Atta colombica]